VGAFGLQYRVVGGGGSLDVATLGIGLAGGPLGGRASFVAQHLLGVLGALGGVLQRGIDRYGGPHLESGAT
jgi:hypothetical protein